MQISRYSFRTSGIYKIILTDEFRTGIDAVTLEYTYGQKAPTGTLTGVENGGYTNGAVSFKCNDEATVTVTKDGQAIEYRARAELREDGYYVITVENFDGMRTTYSFIIDSEDPTVTLNGAENGVTVNKDVGLTHTDSAQLYKNGELVGEYVSDTPITEDGEYRIVISDLAGNETEITFAIDKTAPTLTLNGVENGGTTKGRVTFSETEKKAIVKVFLDGDEMEYSDGDELRGAGTYKVIVSDEYGNTKEYTFTIEQGNNIGLWVLIGLAMLVTVGLVVFFFVQRKNKI